MARRGLLALALAGGGAAQTQARALESDPLVITGTGLGVSAQELSGNLARIGGEAIARTGHTHPEQILNRLPGVAVARGSGQEHLTAIRSPVLTGGAGAGSFLFLEDGVPLRAAGFANVNGLFEAVPELAEAIEVVRGPGSALYGSNAVHGLINVLSREAGAGDFRADALAGPHGRASAAVSSSSAPGGAQGWRGGISFARDDGWRDSSGFTQTKFQARYERAGAKASLRLLLSGHDLKQQTAAYVRGADAYRDLALARSNPAPEAFRTARGIRLQGRIDYAAGPGLRLVVTPYMRQTWMRFLMHFLPGTPVEENGHVSVGVQARAHWALAGGHKIALGADAEYTAGALRQEQAEAGPFASRPAGLHYDYKLRAPVVALFTQQSWNLPGPLTLHAGLRFEHVRYDYDNLAGAGTLGIYRRPADRRDSFTLLTPKLGLVWRVSESEALFVNLARGSRAPQTSDLYRLQEQQRPGALEPEELDSIEIGWRGSERWSWVQWRFEGVVYGMRKRHFHFRNADGLTVADGRTRHWGIEAGLEARLFDHIRLSASRSYARHTYDFSNEIMSERSRSESIRKGDDVDSAPRWLANIALAYEDRRGEIELQWIHVGSYATDAANDHRYPGHNLFNLRARLALGRRFGVFFHVLNLTDRRYAERADFAFGSDRYFPGERRRFHFGLELRL